MVHTLHELRINAGLSQAALAERAGVSASMVVLAEQGRRMPYPANRKRFADVLGVQVSEIAEFRDKRTKEPDGEYGNGRP